MLLYAQHALYKATMFLHVDEYSFAINEQQKVNNFTV